MAAKESLNDFDSDADFDENAAAQHIQELAEKFRNMPKNEQDNFLKSMGVDVEDEEANVSSDTLNFIFYYAPFLICFTLVTLIIVFFGYKLYRSLTEKERKRDQKRKQKQLKKKK